jgi:hypothetical protein
MLDTEARTSGKGLSSSSIASKSKSILNEGGEDEGQQSVSGGDGDDMGEHKEEQRNLTDT